MKRREFIALIGGAATGWPITAQAQQTERIRRIGVLMNLAPDDPDGRMRVTAFLEALQELGWLNGRNVRIDARWAGGNANDIRRYAAELAALSPDVILTPGDSVLGPMLQVTRTVPIVFVQVIDPVGGGAVESLARPGGNATGLTNFEYGMSAKWLETLKEIAPHVIRVAVLRDATNPAEIGQLGAIQTAASPLGVDVSPVGLRDAGEIERAISTFARGPNGGLIVTGSTAATVHRELIVMLAARHRLPAIYSNRIFVVLGGLISYGPDRVDQFRRAASYVDRILKGDKAADLPVQAPTKYELVLNMKTAKALGLTVPPALLTRAEEAIE